MKTKIFLVIIFLILIFFISYFGIYNVFFKIKVDNSGVKIIGETEIEVYSEIFVSDLVSVTSGEIIEDFLIDTTELGKREIQFLYEDKNDRKKFGLFSIQIVDSTSPEIFLSSPYTILVDSDKILTDVIMSVDNYDNSPKREIIGSYKIDKVGNYNLTYKVTDSSGNITYKDFILRVVEEDKPSNIDDTNYVYFNNIVKKYKKEYTSIGIDVSKWQGEIDFKKLKAADVEFMMIRVGSQDGINGDSIIDPYFERNIRGAIENNIKVGIYYYSYAKTIEEAREQALWVVDKLSSYHIQLPIVFDWENWNDFNTFNVSLYDLNQIANTFMNVMEKYNYKSMLYGSKYYLENIWDVDYKNIWLAHYIDKTDYKGNYMMWQLSSTGKIDGIDGYVDIDLLYNN